MPKTALVWRGVGHAQKLNAEFTPILRGYIGTDYQENSLIKGQVETDRLFEQDLAALDDNTTWNITYEPSTGVFSIDQVWDMIFWIFPLCSNCLPLTLNLFLNVGCCRVLQYVCALPMISLLCRNSIPSVMWLVPPKRTTISGRAAKEVLPFSFCVCVSLYPSSFHLSSMNPSVLGVVALAIVDGSNSAAAKYDHIYSEKLGF